MFDKLAIFQTAGAASTYAGNRQGVIAQNIANADTPGYRARQIAPFEEVFALSPERGQRATREGHLSNSGGPSARQNISYSNSEPAPNGNSVSVEDEMLNSIEASRQHSRALAVYRHGMTVIRMTLGR